MEEIAELCCNSNMTPDCGMKPRRKNMSEFEMVEGLTALEQRQLTLRHMVRMVARKVSHALFVFGSQGGLGKSRTIFRTLDEEGIDADPHQ